MLLIQDLKVTKSALSISVAAGHFEDPENCQGLAHLLEHMLFLGSDAYPQSNGINEFFSNHGGSINAWTGTEYANFHFEVSGNHLLDAAHRFADMIAQPIIDIVSMEKEIQAIDAEFKLKQKDDLRRLYQVHKETCNPAHPFSKFSVGNAETLGNVELETLRQRLIDFHRTYYVAKNCKLCVISDLPIKQLKHIITESFSELSSADAKPIPELPPLYLEENLGVQIDIEPIKAARRLIVTFALPDIEPYYRSKPIGLISHILGDEGDGSLLQYLKSNNWCTSLSAGGGIHGRNFKDFNINLQLTALGQENTEKILVGIFSYLKEMRTNLRQDWRYQEKVLMNQQAFDFSDASKAMDDASHYAEQMYYYPLDHVIAGDYMLDQPDFDCVDTFLDLLVPQNMRIKRIQTDIETDKKAKWYNTPYRVNKLSKTLIETLCDPAPIDELTLPLPNPYLIDNFDLQAADFAYEYPRIIKQQAGMEMWFGQDHKFRHPKGDCFISFDCKAISQGIEMSAYKRLWVAMMMEQFNHEYYQAGIAGLHFHLYAHQAGFSLHTNGFSQKQLVLCQEMVDKLLNGQGQPQYFEEMKNKQCIALQNTLLNKPINRLFTRLSVIMQRHAYAPADMLPIVQSATLQGLDRAKNDLMSEYYLESFLHGDWTLQQAGSLADFLTNTALSEKPGAKIIRDVADLRGDERFVNEVDGQNDDAAAVVYIQSPSSSSKDVARTILLEQLLSSPFFSTMRTQKQLGYLVGSGYMPFNQHPGMAFYIQSPNASASLLVQEIHGFIGHSLQNFEMFTPIWEQVKSSVIKQLVENDTNLTMKSQRYWMAIGNEDHEFKQISKLAYAVKNLNFDDMLLFCKKLLKREQVGELILFSHGKESAGGAIDGQNVDDLTRFKSQVNYII